MDIEREPDRESSEGETERNIRLQLIPTVGVNPLRHGCKDTWSWNRRERSQETLISGPGNRTVHFHPNWSKGTAGVRGTRVLNNGRYYWELKLSDRIFGTR